jgi:hypothetical protein
MLSALTLGAIIAAASACESSSMPGNPAGTGSAAVTAPISVWGGEQTLINAQTGQVIQLRVGTVGPGAFDSLPDLSAAAIRFVSTTPDPDIVPAGVRQDFNFVAVTPGMVIVRLSRPAEGDFTPSAMIVDTIVVSGTALPHP